MKHLLLLLALASQTNAADTIAFWQTPQHGGNSFNRLPPDQNYCNALKAYGATWVRLSYDKWKPAQHDFLLGNADHYTALPTTDLATLKSVLARAQIAGLKVVITPLSLPGMRWAQDNNGSFDDRLWQDKTYWAQAATFWRDLANELKDDPAVAAYNLINEPAPEKQSTLPEHADTLTMQHWYQQQAGSPRDLPAFYSSLIKAIREVDPLTPIMLDAGWYAAADSFDYWPEPLADPRILYSFHMYEPYAATSGPNLKRAKPFTYPGLVPFAERNEIWDRQRIETYLQHPLNWAKNHGIPTNRLVMGEFGFVRRLPGCRPYLEDVLTFADTNQIHWAFYSFREDTWDAMDYELGNAKVPWSYWQAIDAGTPDLVRRSATTPEFQPIRQRLSSH
jgi:hypothetical protein